MCDTNLLINKIRVILRDCPPTLHALKRSFPIQMGISITVDVPPLLTGRSGNRFVESPLGRDRGTPVVVQGVKTICDC